LFWGPKGRIILVVGSLGSGKIIFAVQFLRAGAMLTLFDVLSSTGGTRLVTRELGTSMLRPRFQLKEFLSQGIVLLRTAIHEGNVLRAIRVEKMRGIARDTRLRPYITHPNGIEVFAKDKVFK